MVNADKHGINIYTEVLTPDIKTERQFVRKYLKVCEEKGWIPKYHRFLNKSKSGKFIYTKGYYKLLLDFKLFDEKGTILPQKAVVPIFDNEVNKRILEEYVEGEKAKAPNDELYGKVVDAMVEKGRLTEEQVVEAKASAKKNVRFSLAVIRGLSDALNKYKDDGDIATFVEKVREINDNIALGHPYITNVILDYDEFGEEEFVHGVSYVVGDFDGGYAPYTAGGAKYSIALPEETAYSNIRYSVQETDPVILDALNNGETMKVYRAMQVIDGELYPPMSAKVDGKLRNPIKIGVWERAEERPDLADEKGNFKLDKGNKTRLKARYNPYIHTSLTPLNDQFSSAQDRPNLVTVEVEVPVSELTSGYKAEKAKDAVGKLEWKAGVVQGQLTGTRTVILSRWDRPLRIVPDSEVAQRIVEMFGDTKVVMPSNVVTPSLRAELEKLGVPFRETTNQGKPRLSISDIPAYEASAELSVYLNAYRRDKITLNSLVNKVEDVVGKYSKTGLLKQAIDEYKSSDQVDVEINAFIHRIEGFISIYPPKVLQDYTKEKETIGETFGGIWIDDTQEFVNFAKAVNNTPFEEDGEGIAYTDNYFYAYYRNIDGQPIPFASVYMNKDESQDIVNTILKAKRNGEKTGIRRYFDRAYERARHISSKNDGHLGTDKNPSNPRRNDRVDSELSQYGAYYDSPELFVKSARAYKGRRINYSLITPEMDADYLSAVERGDMATAQQMVMEAAKLAMPNTKVVDKNGNPKVVYHQTNHSVYINRETGQNWDELDWRERMEWDERDDWDEYWEEQEFNTFSRVNARTTNEFDGFFFAPEYDEYHEYGNRTIEAFLNIENPASNGDYYIDSSKNNAGRAERIRLQNEGYDGVIREYDGVVDEYIAFSPNQIKSAEPVTYDDNGNVIPLAERFNPEKEDIRYSINDFDSKVGYITYEANALGVEQTIIVAETLNEYLEALKDLGVKDIERYKKSAGIYDEEAYVIVMRSDIIQYEQQAFETLIHEYAHAHTNNLRGEIENVLQRLDEGLIFAYRDEKLHEIYRKISANGILGA